MKMSSTNKLMEEGLDNIEYEIKVLYQQLYKNIVLYNAVLI